MIHELSCRCGEVIVKSNNSDTKIRAKIVLFRNNEAFAVCKGCNGEVKVPLQLDTVLLKSLADPKSIPLYVRNAKKS